MGLSLGIGVALAGKDRDLGYKVYVVLGDGECNEGSVWESAMAAPHFGLDNIVTIVDRNNFQQTGANVDIMNLGNLAQKWESFGWNVIELDGHNYAQLLDSLLQTPIVGTPTAIIANTIKGKGVSFLEGHGIWHHKIPSEDELNKIKGELL